MQRMARYQRDRRAYSGQTGHTLETSSTGLPVVAKGSRVTNAIRDRYWALAQKRRWTVRSDPRGFVKVFDPRTGNVAFAETTARAVWGLVESVQHVTEINHALIRILIERGPGCSANNGTGQTGAEGSTA